MAKAVFQRNQKVWVENVGAWAMIEKIDAGLGQGLRRAGARHLRRRPRPAVPGPRAARRGPDWRYAAGRRRRVRLAADAGPQQVADAGGLRRTIPIPAPIPVVVTDLGDWGGWRVPGAEYDRDPRRIEWQARLIACTPALRQIAREVLALVSEAADVPPELAAIGAQDPGDRTLPGRSRRAGRRGRGGERRLTAA